MSRFLAVMLLAAMAVTPSFGQMSEGDGVRVSGGQPEDDCTGPPDGAERIEYTIVYTQAQPLALPATTTILAMSDGLITVQDRQQIRTEAEYARVFGKPSIGIDWKTSRIVVVKLTTTYKLGDIESGQTLSGVWQDTRGIYVGTDYKQYGPIQGIAQLSEWFTYADTDLFLLVPAEPENLEFFYCIIGGRGPTDIP